MASPIEADLPVEGKAGKKATLSCHKLLRKPCLSYK